MKLTLIFVSPEAENAQYNSQYDHDASTHTCHDYNCLHGQVILWGLNCKHKILFLLLTKLY